jgi:hypothetical protein
VQARLQASEDVLAELQLLVQTAEQAGYSGEYFAYSRSEGRLSAASRISRSSFSCRKPVISRVNVVLLARKVLSSCSWSTRLRAIDEEFSSSARRSGRDRSRLSARSATPAKFSPRAAISGLNSCR